MSRWDLLEQMGAFRFGEICNFKFYKEGYTRTDSSGVGRIWSGKVNAARRPQTDMIKYRPSYIINSRVAENAQLAELRLMDIVVGRILSARLRPQPNRLCEGLPSHRDRSKPTITQTGNNMVKCDIEVVARNAWRLAR